VTNFPVDVAAERYAATLVVRQLIRATPEVLFAAWTDPKHLVHWWGPEGVACTGAEVDLRVGGEYRIANQFPDGSTIWIVGVFEIVEAPHRLRYSWRIESQQTDSEQVTVSFERRGASTEVIVEHERITTAAIRKSHEQGWNGCLAGLVGYVTDL
jgi:uncharacterized protein YndB with AHSA1/START domain